MVNRAELAAVLKRARSRVSPTDVGLPAGVGRRVAGLRREEVAQLAGISVDYLVRLEQARGPQPSRAVLVGLARALRLDEDERNELLLLGGSPPLGPGLVVLEVRPSMLRLMERLADQPTIVISAKGDVLAWNDLACALLGDFSALPIAERNIVWQRFLGDPNREVARVAMSPAETAETAGQAVAGLRTAAASYPGDPSVHRLIEDLRRHSPDFERLWQTSRTGAWRSHRKTIEHPQIGQIVLDCDSLVLPDTDQRMIVYSAVPGSPDAAALALLRVIGTQQLAEA